MISNISHAQLFGRQQSIFYEDMLDNEAQLLEAVQGSKVLVVGGGGSIGREVVYQIYKRNPKRLCVVDLSENGLVEVVRTIRSGSIVNCTEFETYCLDCGAVEFRYFMREEGPFDYVLNLSAMKHVRSERDKYTLMRMLRTNILNAVNMHRSLISAGARNHFCVSTDKAANPANAMGASKRAMEIFLFSMSELQSISMARFANVAFSDGSLTAGFNYRMQKGQPISAPCDIRRYFMTPEESGELCTLATVFGKNKEVFLPKLSAEADIFTFSEIAETYLKLHGFEPYVCETEEQARADAPLLISEGKYPCFFFRSDTSGEKSCEEFFTKSEVIDWGRYRSVGIINNSDCIDVDDLHTFEGKVQSMLTEEYWLSGNLIKWLQEIVPEFSHLDRGKNLDQRM